MLQFIAGDGVVTSGELFGYPERVASLNVGALIAMNQTITRRRIEEVTHRHPGEKLGCITADDASADQIKLARRCKDYKILSYSSPVGEMRP
jgi:hypothetical protein